jgi:hypothetical protein
MDLGPCAALTNRRFYGLFVEIQTDFNVEGNKCTGQHFLHYLEKYAAGGFEERGDLDSVLG